MLHPWFVWSHWSSHRSKPSKMLPGPHSTWHIGEEVAFEGDAVRRETWLMVVPKVYFWQTLGNSREGNGNSLKVKQLFFVCCDLILT